MLAYSRESNPISIHTPAKGVTHTQDICTPGKLYFNPHPREGGDHLDQDNYILLKDFNPHPREGGDFTRL